MSRFQKTVLVLIIIIISLLGYMTYLSGHSSEFTLPFENIFKPTLSPNDVVKKELNDLKLEVNYNRPSKRGREIFGALVPYDKVWRTGANEATTFTTNKTLMIDSVLVPKGTYTLWTVPSDTLWKVMVNKKQYDWGVDEKLEPMWDPNFDVVEVRVPVIELDQVVEKFTIDFVNTLGKLKMTLAWDTTKIEIPIQHQNISKK